MGDSVRQHPESPSGRREVWCPAPGKAAHSVLDPQALQGWPRLSHLSHVWPPPQSGPRHRDLASHPQLGQTLKQTLFQVWLAKVIWGPCPSSKSPSAQPCFLPLHGHCSQEHFLTHILHTKPNCGVSLLWKPTCKQPLMPSFT